MITENAHAKINLSLDVCSRRPDGYHEVSMIMQTIELHDVLTFEKIDEDRILLSTDSDMLTDMDKNLVSKAAGAFKKRFNIEEGVKAHLQKNIPIAAGLAGGSADAAATLRALNELFEVHAEIDELCDIAAGIGADVPFCVRGGTMHAGGIGEKLTPVAHRIKAYCLLVKPDFPVPTAFVYNNLVLDAFTEHPDINAGIKAVENGSLEDLARVAGNVLETVTCAHHPELEDIKKKMLELGAGMALMSGSGPTVFGLFKEHETCKAAYEAFNTGDYASRVIMTNLM